MLLSFVQGPRVLAPPTVLLRRSMNLVRGCLEPLLHGRGGVRVPYGELVPSFSSLPASRSRLSLELCAHGSPRNGLHSACAQSQSPAVLMIRSASPVRHQPPSS